jgi:heptosyltransferase-2
MKILVIRFTSMGDVVLATSLFSSLKKIYPVSNIHFLTDARYAELFKDDPRLKTVIGTEKNVEHETLRPLYDTHWDAVIDLQHNKRSFQFKKKLAMTTRIGVFEKRHRQRLLLLLTRHNFYDPDDSVVNRYIKASAMADEASFVAPPLRLFIDDQESQRRYAAFFNGPVVRPLIALFPFSAWKNKEWSRDSFCIVGRYFLAKGWDVAIFGGPEDRQAAIDMQMRIGQRCKALAGQLSLYECACILKQASLALGNDTGLSHIARACGVKTGMIFGSTTSHFGFFPFGNPPYKVFQTAYFCRPCHPHGGNICFLKNRPCLQRIMPEAVIKGLEELHRDRS